MRLHRSLLPVGEPIGFSRKGKPIYLVAGGSESAVEQPVGDDQDPNAGTVEPQETQAPWSKYLEDIPTSIHPVVESKFKEWDADVTRRFQSIHNEYEPLKAYQSLYDEGYDPQQLQQLAEAINNDPRQVYEALVSQFGTEWGLNNPPVDDTVDEEFPEYDPKVRELESTVNTMADILLEQHRTEQAAQEDAQLDAYLGSLKQQYGDFDERYVLGLMNAGVSGEDAVTQFQETINSALQQRNRPPAPRILGSGGGVPVEQPDLSTPQSRKQIVAQMLANAKQQG